MPAMVRHELHVSLMLKMLIDDVPCLLHACDCRVVLLYSLGGRSGAAAMAQVFKATGAAAALLLEYSIGKEVAIEEVKHTGTQPGAHKAVTDG